MIFAIRLLGQELLAVEVQREQPSPHGITGGSSHNFEREQPLEYVEEFGFGATTGLSGGES